MEVKMTLTSIMGFLSLAGWMAVLAGAGIAISNAAQNRPTRGGIALAAFGLVVGVVFFLASTGLVTVGATQVAVVFQSIGGDPEEGNLWKTPLGPGVHIIMPIINEPILYTTAVQTYTMSRVMDEGQARRADAVEGRTRDGQQVLIDVSVLYRIDRDIANTLHRKWQNRYENDFVRPTVRSAVRERVANYSVNELYGGTSLITTTDADTGESRTEQAVSKLPELQRRLNEELRPVFADNGLFLQELLIREITFSEEFIRAVEAKQVAEQQAEQAKQEAERARTLASGQADAAVTAARGEANALRERANGEAAAIRARAAAEAEALALINEQITKNPMLLQWRYIEQIAPNISMILLPSNAPFLFDIEQLMQQARR
ncbi:MAG: prohibitin family protein [Chloroflexi bacterium CFX4]|nr:prohibitin family protein [Chloroflexi bacterium CFX4]MDL1922382.1 prohibitin family protein [Chloroflexi bacterium CFX3]